ncbi:MAG: peroxiredoxin-like family protein [Saprospiraceae bacterium]|nr:peroxiredoxin-like family protein [Saprospiraceae bacterium]
MLESPVQNVSAIWPEMITVNSGENLATLSDKQPVLLVFLRHFGCSFCREAVTDIARVRPELEKNGLRIVLVHMAAEPEIANKFFKRFNLFPVDHIADPEKRFYRAFGLGRGTPAQLFGLMSWIRGFESAVVNGHGMQPPNEDIGDGFQMPGVFVLFKGEIKNSFVHGMSHDRPDYLEIVRCCAF